MKVAIVMGSDSDLEIMKEAVDTLEKMGIESYVSITSAHRTPEKVGTFLKEVERSNCEVIIAGAGMAAHLAGVIAASTIIPVIGVPMPGGALNGADALYSTVMMPGGIPVATVAIGKAGAVNAGILAAEILALKYPELKKTLKKHKEKDAKLQKKGVKKYLEDKGK
jgi:5-(carboxyamino)imidazole ribonucleotide mutase